MNQPTLVIIAGPNGAGKSSLSKFLLSDFEIEAFDFDKEFYAAWMKFGYDPVIEAGIKVSTVERFENEVKQALTEKSHYAFETNFSDEAVMDHVRNAKESGLLTHLIFIGLSSIEQAQSRVDKRVQKKGHYVSPATIKERFVKGLELLDKFHNEFDVISLYDSQDKYQNIFCGYKYFDKKGLLIRPSFANHIPSLMMSWQRG